MKPQDIFLSVRYEINDIAGNDVSDYQILNKYNSVMRMINTALGAMNSTLVQKSVILTMVNGSADLPTDYDSVVTVKGSWELYPQTASQDVDNVTYKIISNKLYATGDVTFIYNSSYTPITLDDIGNTLSLPDSLFELIKTSIVSLIGGATIDPAYIQQQVANKVAMRDRTSIKRKPLIQIYDERSR
jgi:hypothetical protein